MAPSSPTPSPHEGPRFARLRRWLRRALVFTLACALAGVGTVALVVRHYESGLPSVEQLRAGYDPPLVTRILARDGSLLAELYIERRTYVPISEVPKHVRFAFVAAEDARFYQHEGLNYFGMLRALIANVRAGHTVQGGSTITQQVVKNTLLDPERTYERKIKETILARRVEQHLGKDEILELYLNHIYLGHGRYGIEEASRYYFGKHARDLDLREAATLSGLVASPERFSPRRDPKKNRERRRYVIDQLVEKGFITPGLGDQTRALGDPPLHPPPDEDRSLAPEAVTWVRRVLVEVAGERAARGGFEITTTIDPALQAEVRRAVRQNLAAYARRQKLVPPYTDSKRRLWGKPGKDQPKNGGTYLATVQALDDAAGTITLDVAGSPVTVHLPREERYDPAHLVPTAFTKIGALLRVRLTSEPDEHGPASAALALGPESAAVAIDPRTREIRALVGGYDALPGALDRATQSRRQPGSAFKPFVYGYALHARRFTPATLLSFPASGDGKVPERKLRVREGLARSDNAVAQKLLVDSGPANVVAWAHGAGIDSKLGADLSLALGSYEVTPLELTNAITTYAASGEFAPPVLVTKIVGPDHRELPLPPALPPRRVMEPAEAYLTTSLMRSVVTSGTAVAAMKLGRPVVGKTGTTNDARDAWFVGFSPDLVVGVWVGYDDPSPLGWGESGAVTALPAWIDVMRAAQIPGKPATDFVRPAGITVVKIDPATGLLALPDQEGALEEEFLDGTAPVEVTTLDAGAEGGSDAGMDDESRQARADAAPPAASPDASAPAPAPSASASPRKEFESLPELPDVRGPGVEAPPF